jgi:hypothetical protein
MILSLPDRCAHYARSSRTRYSVVAVAGCDLTQHHFYVLPAVFAAQRFFDPEDFAPFMN